MPRIFDGLADVIDEFLRVDETWRGGAPRYFHEDTLKRLCKERSPDIDGVGLVRTLYDRILANWKTYGGACGPPSVENWRFKKRTNFGETNLNPETLLERTIASVVDGDNWANQVPVDSGLLGGSAHWIDLVFRAGTEFSFIELKCEANTPLTAAIQVLRYGLVYAFSRSHADHLGIDLNRSPILNATALHLRVLAPALYYSAYGPNLDWLVRFERAVHTGVEQFSRENSRQFPSMSFKFEAFPEDFQWTPQTAKDVGTQKDVLWAIHRRKHVFPA